MKKYAWSAAAVVFTIALVPVKAGPIIIVDDPAPVNYVILGPAPVGEQIAAASWSTSGTFTNVSVFATLFNFLNTDATGLAFLTTQIGPGATPDSLIAQTTFTLPSGAYELDLFHVPVLPAGTYNLVLYTLMSSSDIGWLASESPVIIQAPGVSEAGYRYANAAFDPNTAIDLGYLPASRFAPFTSPDMRVLYAVEGAAVPEPSALLLALSGIVFLAAWNRRRA